MLLLWVACKPFTEKQQKKDGIPVDCTLSIPSLPEVTRQILQDPSNAVLYRVRSQILIDSGRHAEALSDAKRALSLNPEDQYNFVVVAKAHRAMGHVDSALSACATAEQNGFKDPDNYLLMGDLYLIIRQYGKSLDYLNKALKMAPFEPRIYFLKGMVFWETKDTTKALSNWQTSIEQDPEYADGYCRLATYYMERKKYDVAEQYLRSGLRLRPGDAFLQYDMGVFLTYRGFPDSASRFYEQALKLNPSLIPAKINLGVLRYENGRYEEALNLLEPCRNEDPKNPLLAYYLGLSYDRNDQKDKAEAEFRRAVLLGGEYGKKAEKKGGKNPENKASEKKASDSKKAPEKKKGGKEKEKGEKKKDKPEKKKNPKGKKASESGKKENG
jgi:tetratricopeptide (TPR) repeat protein